MTNVPAPHRISLVENLDAITDFNEHLRVVDELLQRFVSESRRHTFSDRIEAIAHRAADPALSLAVIGEFSSGKSTFINGLLRSRLLKTASIATTAAVTRVRKGPVLTVTAAFTDDRAVAATAGDFSELRRTLSVLQPDVVADTSLKDLLDRLAADPKVADGVRFIDIEFPAEELAEDIVILDTPGIGAGASTAWNHEQITQRVVLEVADCALVLIPSAQAMTNTLIEFLADYARPFLHRCIFVITAMDRLEEDERAEIRALVYSKLQEKLGLESPKVFESAAVTMLPNVRVPESLQEEWPVWQSRFVALEASIREALLRDRSLIVAERLIRLLQELLVEMDRELVEKQSALQAEEELLRENTVASLEVVLGDLQTYSAGELEHYRRGILVRCRQHLDTAKVSTRDWLHRLIEHLGWGIKEYEAKVHPQVVEGVEHYARQYAQSVNQELTGLHDCCQTLADGFARQFEDNYKDLSSLGVPVSVPSVVLAPLTDRSAFGSTLEHAARQFGRDQRRGVAGGALGGLTLGWLGVFPGAWFGGAIGAMLGGLAGDGGCSQFFFAIVGALLGIGPGVLVGLVTATYAGGSIGKAMAGAAGPKLLVRQKQLQDHLGAAVDAFFDQERQQFDDHIEATVRETLTSFRNAADLHKQEYSSAVESLRREHDSQREAVARQIAEARVANADLSQRTTRLETIRRRLMRSSSAA